MPSADHQPSDQSRRGVRRSLSLKLLILTVVFVLLAELLVLAPSIAYRRLEWLNQRIEAAYLVGLALEAPEAEMVKPETASRLFATAGVLGVMINQDGANVQILAPDVDYEEPPPMIYVDLRMANLAVLAADAWSSFFSRGDGWVRVVGEASLGDGKEVDIIIAQRALRTELRRFSLQLLLISLVIATTAAALMYGVLDRLIVNPVTRLARNMTAFEASPEDPAAVIKPSAREDEIGAAERNLRELETRIQALLSQRRRLAALGAGVSKITHDLRNILASAQLMSDRLAASDDPRVKKLSPRLIQSLDRAIALSRDVLSYARMEPAALQKTTFALRPLIEEAFEDAATTGADFVNEVPAGLSTRADRTQLYRALFNLVRNAADAAAPAEDAAARRGRVVVRAERGDGGVRIEIEDNGPGLSPAARETLFQPFAASTKPGGSGLGAAIAHEIARAHGGALTLKATGPQGSVFILGLPDA
jgi:signal transduction histidine kinase